MNTTAIRPIIRAKDFYKVTGIPDSTRAVWENPKSKYYDPTFPKKVRLGPRTVGYFLDEVLAWLESRQEKTTVPEQEKAKKTK